MSDCDETLNELDRFLDHELEGTSRREIEAHLAECVLCLQAFDFHAELRLVIAHKCHNDELPEGFVDRLKRCLELGMPVPAPDRTDGQVG